MVTRRLVLIGGGAAFAAGFAPARLAVAASTGIFPVTHTDAEWRQLLSPAQYAVLRQNATERPFSSPLLGEHRPSIFVCTGCDRGLFSSETKFDSGTGWPSFWAPLNDDAIGTTQDTSLGMVRTAVHCAGCEGHLGRDAAIAAPGADRGILLGKNAAACKPPWGQGNRIGPNLWAHYLSAETTGTIEPSH